MQQRPRSSARASRSRPYLIPLARTPEDDELDDFAPELVVDLERDEALAVLREAGVRLG